MNQSIEMSEVMSVSEVVSVRVSGVVENGLSRMLKEYGLEVSKELGKLYGFDGLEGWRRMGGDVGSAVVVKGSNSKKVVVVESDGVVKAKGRPKKAKKDTSIVGETSSLFTELMSEMKLSSSSLSDDMEREVDVDMSVPVVVDKVAAKAVKDGEKAAAKAVKDAEKVAAKAVKDGEKAAAKAVKEAAKVAKDAEKESNVSVNGSKKPNAKGKKSSGEYEEKKSSGEEEVKKEEVKKVEVKKVAESLEVAESSKPDVAKKFTHNGVTYLRSSKTGIIYNMSEEVLGEWDGENKCINFYEEEDEEEEEEYDE